MLETNFGSFLPQDGSGAWDAGVRVCRTTVYLRPLIALFGHDGGRYVFRRSRWAFARARFTNGATIAAWPFPLTIALIAVWIAAVFSVTIRRYSAEEQVPCTISRVRRVIVSHEAADNSAIVRGIVRLGKARLIRLAMCLK